MFVGDRVSPWGPRSTKLRLLTWSHCLQIESHVQSAGWGWGQGGQAQLAPGSTAPGGTLGTFLRELSLQSAWFVLLIKCHGQFVFRKRAAVIYPPDPLGRDCWLPRPQPNPGNTSPSSLAFISWPVSLISEFSFWWYESSFALSDHVRCTCKVGKTSTVFLWWNQSSDFLIMDLDYEFYK